MRVKLSPADARRLEHRRNCLDMQVKNVGAKIKAGKLRKMSSMEEKRLSAELAAAELAQREFINDLQTKGRKK